MSRAPRVVLLSEPLPEPLPELLSPESTVGRITVAAAVVLALAALVSIWRSAAHSSKVKLIWTLLALIPLVGPVAWFALGRGLRVR